ncbi:MAG TPA: lysophospholipid acyltransferase family protein [Pseudobdellovibrionaceae bacterium]|nr:lysophospholipid acyltransferase family protein [Pseudobdellovibrionaceae bacterium]
MISGFCIHLITRDLERRKRRFSAHATFWCRFCCRIFRIKVLVKNRPQGDRPGLVVGNHLGFIDLLACASVQPNLFVTSREMRETPVLGLITEMAGCIYVERRSRANILNELGEMIDYLRKGFRVVLYPEATSTNGEGVLPFKRTLITAAAHAGVPVVPYVFNFREINGEPGFQLKYRDSVCWYGDISFIQAIWNAFSLKSLVCEVEFLSPVYTKTDDDRAVVADAIREMIVAKFNPVDKTERF